jgi:hypothetical protein
MKDAVRLDCPSAHYRSVFVLLTDLVLMLAEFGFDQSSF